jgi:hypothetical protein
VLWHQVQFVFVWHSAMLVLLWQLAASSLICGKRRLNALDGLQKEPTAKQQITAATSVGDCILGSSATTR